jgi:site-specific recombinase XerD
MTVRHSRRPAKQAARPECLSQATLNDFVTHLNSRGYAANTIQQYVAIAKRFRAWLRRSKKRKQGVDEASVVRFVQRCKAKYHLRHVHHIQSSLRHLVQMLRNQGKLAERPEQAPTAIDVAIQEFTSHLRDTCGLAKATCRHYARYVRRFLDCRYGSGPLRLDRLCCEDLVSFVGDYAKEWTPASTQSLTSALRKYLSYLQLQGRCSKQLAAAVPTTPRWRLANLPRTMTEDQLHTLLASFNRSTDIGRRNYAIVMLMSTLGLRAGEVALLQLDDVNWRDSSLRIVSPKSRRTKILPLPNTVGRAIADYLRHGRPLTSHRHIFTRHVAPRDIPLNGNSIRGMAICAYRRCGFDPRWKGTHILRHTVATHLHQRGATLKEVADLLGHRSIETSAIYAKVNLPALAAVALPWPEVTT